MISPCSSTTSTPSSIVLNSVSRKLRSRASRCTTVCRPSVSSRPIRPSTLSKKLDLTAISEPFPFLKIPIRQSGGDQHNPERHHVTVLPRQLRHVVKIHPIPRPNHHQRRGDYRDQRQQLHHFARLVRRHVQVHLQNARQGIRVLL